MPAVLPPPHPLVAAAEPAAQPISVETALLVILGIALVFAFKAIAQLHRRVESLHAVRPPKPAAAASPASDGIPPEVLAVISAAVFEMLGDDSRIVAISPEAQNNTWSLEGRRQIFVSRKTR
jgi:hypothetical protein